MKIRWFGMMATGLATAVMCGNLALAAPQGEGKGDGERPKRERAERDGERPKRDGERPQRDGERRGSFIRALFDGITLDEAQKTEVREIARGHAEEVKAWHEEHRDEFEAIRAKMREARQNKDREAGEAARKQLETLMATRPKPDATFAAMREVLATDADKTKFDENLQKLRERMQERRERGPKGGDGERPKRDGDKERSKRGAEDKGGLDI